MTTIQDLPEELLTNIFSSFCFNGLRQCQKVCRSWYFPAHTLLLKEIHLDSLQIVLDFIASIDYNPDSSYLHAVKNIYIDAIDENDEPPHDYKCDQDMIDKLFMRFSNLKYIVICNFPPLLEEFNQEKCTQLIQSCPQLDTFQVYNRNLLDYEQYPSTLWKLRPVLTTLIVNEVVDGELPVDLMQYITSFPRLQTLISNTDQFDDFVKVLRVVQHLSNLKAITLNLADHEEDFAEKFLSSKSRDEQDRIVKRLSNISRITLLPDTDFCVNAVKFISKYMTGLTSFDLYALKNQNWTDLHRHVFCNDIVDILCSAINDGRIHIERLKFSDMAAVIPALTQKLFRLSKRTRSLVVNMMTNIESKEMGNMLLFTPRFELKLQASKKLALAELTQRIFQTTIDNVDMFTLHLDRRRQHDIDVNAYIDILEKMPSLKSVILDVPASIKETDSTYNPDLAFPLVTNLEIQATPGINLQGFLDRQCLLFPNLQRLKLFRYSGVYDQENGEFRVVLTNYTLDKLKIDLTPVKTKMKADQSFFTIAVRTLNDRQLYKVPSDLSTVDKVDDNDLDGYVLGEDYIQVHIVVTDLKCLEIYMFHDEDRQDTDEDSTDEEELDEEENAGGEEENDPNVEENNDSSEEEEDDEAPNNDIDSESDEYEEYDEHEDSYDQEDCRKQTIILKK